MRFSTNSVKFTEFAYYVAEWCSYKETCNKITHSANILLNGCCVLSAIAICRKILDP